MKRWVGVVMVVGLLAAAIGCTMKIGNTQVGLLEGWNQPSVSTQKTETVTPPVTSTTVAK